MEMAIRPWLSADGQVQHFRDAEQAKIDASWDKEINSRIDEIMSGKVELVDVEETRRMIHAELAERRK